MSTKRERENERRRYEKWQERRAVAQARRRDRVIAWSIIGVLVLGTGVGVAVALSDDGATTAEPSPTATVTSPCTPVATAISTEPRTGNGGEVPEPSAAQDRTWTSTISTNCGDITLELDGAAAPQAVANFVTLADEGYFDATSCHRLVTAGIFVLQCGDPTATGSGTPGYSWGPIENAPEDDLYPAGTLAMARVGGDGESMGSQFFLVYEDSTILSDEAGGYTVFGRITSGLDVVQAIADAGTGSDGVAPVSDVIIEGVLTQ